MDFYEGEIGKGNPRTEEDSIIGEMPSLTVVDPFCLILDTINAISHIEYIGVFSHTSKQHIIPDPSLKDIVPCLPRKTVRSCESLHPIIRKRPGQLAVAPSGALYLD